MTSIRRARVLFAISITMFAAALAPFALPQREQGSPPSARRLAVENGSVRINYPSTLAELVADVDIVVIAELGESLGAIHFLGYNIQGTKIIPTQTPSSPMPGPSSVPGALPFTDFVIDPIIDVLLDDGTIQAEEAVVLRMPGQSPVGSAPLATDQASWYPMGVEGDLRMFFLHSLPDETYSLKYGPCSRIVMDEQYVRCSDGDATVLSFMENSTPSEFADLVSHELD